MIHTNQYQQTNPFQRGKIPLSPETPTNPDPLLMGLRVFFRSCKLVPVSGTFPPPENATWHWLIHAVWTLWKMSYMAYIDLVLREIVTVVDNIWLHVASVLVLTVQSLHVWTVTNFVLILTEITLLQVCSHPWRIILFVIFWQIILVFDLYFFII